MKKRAFMMLRLCTLAFGTLTAGCAMGGAGVRSAGTDAAYGQRAERALERRDPAAVALAEAAVQAEPGRADRRFVLARAYLVAGRFESARQAFGDVVTLDPANGRAALNLALTQIACDDVAGARETLVTYGDRIGAADRGLALAIAGEPEEAVTLLMAAARQPGADARVRQNLALSLGLSGQWQMARAVAAVDVSPADLDARMLDWIAFAQPRTSGARVAALLHVEQQPDMGQPTALALVRAPTQAAAVAVEAEPLGTVLAAQEVPAAARRVVFGPRQEVVQPLPGRIALAAAGARKAP